MKWRCPNAGVSDDGQLPLACSPASVWIKADRRNPLVPRQTKRWGDLYRGRSAVEREFGRLLLTETTFPPVGDGKTYPVGAIFRKSTEVAPFRVRKLAAGLISAA